MSWLIEASGGGFLPLPDNDPLRWEWPQLRVLAEVGAVYTGSEKKFRAAVRGVWAEVESLRTVVERVREIHVSDGATHGRGHCSECGDIYPCATARVVELP